MINNILGIPFEKNRLSALFVYYCLNYIFKDPELHRTNSFNSNYLRLFPKFQPETLEKISEHRYDADFL